MNNPSKIIKILIGVLVLLFVVLVVEISLYFFNRNKPAPASTTYVFPTLQPLPTQSIPTNKKSRLPTGIRPPLNIPNIQQSSTLSAQSLLQNWFLRYLTESKKQTVIATSIVTTYQGTISELEKKDFELNRRKYVLRIKISAKDSSTSDFYLDERHLTIAFTRIDGQETSFDLNQLKVGDNIRMSLVESIKKDRLTKIIVIKL